MDYTPAMHGDRLVGIIYIGSLLLAFGLAVLGLIAKAIVPELAAITFALIARTIAPDHSRKMAAPPPA